MQGAFYLLNKHKRMLTKQQYKTIKGQIIAGDAVGAMKGLKNLLDKKNKSKVSNSK